MPGPSATPTAIKQLQGNPGRRRLNEDEPRSPPLSVNAPEWVEQDELVKEFYYAVGNTVRAMNVAQESDAPALELLSICLAEVRRAYQQLGEDGRTDYTAQGGETPSAHFKIMSKMIAQAMSIMKEFGMTPAARSRVKTLAKGENKSRLSAFLEGGGD